MDDDLSEGRLVEEDKGWLKRQLKEEDQRLDWKTYALWGVAGLIVLFTALLVAWILKLLLMDNGKQIWAEHIYILVVLSAIPTLLVINFLKLVTSRQPEESTGFENNPWVSLVRDVAKMIVDAIKSK